MRRDDSEIAGNHSSTSAARPASPVGEQSDVNPQTVSEDSVLHPDVSFGAQPWVHILQVILLTGGYITSIGVFLAYVPLERKPGQPMHSGIASAPWLAILLPLIISSFAGVIFHVYYALVRRRAIEMQLGPPPNPQTTPGGAILQHSILQRVFTKQYVASNVSDAVLFMGMAASKCICLGYLLHNQLPIWRVVVLPFAVAGISSLVLHTLYRVRSRAALPSISTRTDFMVVFVYLVAYKLDSDASLSWTITFIFGFWWVCVSILIGVCALMVYYSGRRAQLWRPAGLRVRAAVAVAHLSSVLLLVALSLLQGFMRAGHDLRDPSHVPRLRASLAFVIAWLAASSAAQVVVWMAQREREQQRALQIAQGRVWTSVYNALSTSSTVAQQVDSLSPEEIAQKATEMMSGVSKPARLFRLDVNLWSTERRIAPAVQSHAVALGDDSCLEDSPPVSPAKSGECDNAPGTGAAALPKPEAGGAPAGEVALAVAFGSEDGDGAECACVICYEGAADHVVLPCGHGGYCRSCAIKVFVRPPSQCPVCRTRLKSIVQVSLDTPIGESSQAS